MRSSIFRIVAITFVLVYANPSPVLAGGGDGVEKRIVFTKARPTITLRGKLPRQTADYDAFIFRARKGQTISVKLTTADRDASFSIYELKELGPEEDLILPSNEMTRLYTGVLPITSEYAVQVYGKAFATEKPGPGPGASYTIEISLR